MKLFGVYYGLPVYTYSRDALCVYMSVLRTRSTWPLSYRNIFSKRYEGYQELISCTRRQCVFYFYLQFYFHSRKIHFRTFHFEIIFVISWRLVYPTGWIRRHERANGDKDRWLRCSVLEDMVLPTALTSNLTNPRSQDANKPTIHDKFKDIFGPRTHLYPQVPGYGSWC